MSYSSAKHIGESGLSKESLKGILEAQRLILKRLDVLEKRVEEVERGPPEVKERPEPGEGRALDITDLLGLPDHLRTSVIAVVSMGDATAEEAAEMTGRVRNLESSYLNQLVRLGHLTKVRRGRKIHFRPVYIKKEAAELLKTLGSKMLK